MESVLFLIKVHIEVEGLSFFWIQVLLKTVYFFLLLQVPVKAGLYASPGQEL